jgi:hypothetical protein
MQLSKKYILSKSSYQGIWLFGYQMQTIFISAFDSS